jgi:tRNA nucleotidyltransferase (CCA-adding enzyme)
MKIELPGQVKTIISTLEEQGFEAYAVGGCVRDSLLGRNPSDWDITTSALPEEVKKWFRRTVDTGIQHGTVTVLLDGTGFEVTTYRLDGEYEDGRHPREVLFTSRLREDLQRRDFTINAMAYNDREGLVDLFDGTGDMERKVIRCVGNPKERFGEDALRILRAVRFSAQLGFSIEEETKEAIEELSPNLQKISAERIQTELVKLAVSSHPEEILTAYQTGITRVILPEFDQAMETEQRSLHHLFCVGEHLAASMKAVEQEKGLRLAALLHDIGKPLVKSTDEEGQDHFYGHGDVSAEMAKGILRRLKFDNETIRRVTKLIAFHDDRPDLTERSVRRLLSKTGAELFFDVLKLQKADVAAQSDYRREEKLEYLEKVRIIGEEILRKKQCFCLKDLAVKGQDLIMDGMKPGKDMGRVLDALLKEVLEDPEKNEKTYLLEYSRSIR